MNFLRNVEIIVMKKDRPCILNKQKYWSILISRADKINFNILKES